MSAPQNKRRIPGSAAVAILISIASLALSFGAMRWSILIMEEQLKLRNELEQLRARQNQVTTQYDLWLERVAQELEDAGLTE